MSVRRWELGTWRTTPKDASILAKQGMTISINDRLKAVLPAITNVLIIGVASMNGYYIGIKTLDFNPLWIAALLWLNWTWLSLLYFLGEKWNDQN